MGNLKLKRLKKMSNFRKFSIANWNDNFDPTTASLIQIRMENAIQYISKFKRKYKKALTPMHLMIKACAITLKKNPEANVILRFKKLYMRENITISAPIVNNDGEYVTVRIENADKLSILEIIDILRNEIEKVRNDSGNTGPEAFLSKFPVFILKPVFSFLSFLMFSLNISLKFLGFIDDAYGVLEITNIGSLGFDNAVLPLTPNTNVLFVIGIGIIKEIPVVDNGKLSIGKVMSLSISFDHRFIDGYHGAKLIKTVKDMMENPFEHFDKI